MTQKYLLTNKEAISILLIITINKIILNIPYSLVTITETGTFINLLFLLIISFIILNIIINLFKKFPSSDIIDISNFLGGNILKTIIGILFIILFFVSSSITLIDFTTMLQIVYFKEFSKLYILLFFFVGIFISNLLGFKSIVNAIQFIIPSTILSIIISLIGMNNTFEISNLLPVFGKDFYTTFIKGSSNIFSLFIISYFLFLKPILKNPDEYKKIVLHSFFLSFLLLVLATFPILNLYTNTNNSESINFIYILSKNIKFGSFLNRVDALFILLWTFCTLSYVSISINMINNIFSKILKIENKKQITYFSLNLLIILTILPFNISEINFIENTIYKILVTTIIIIIPLIILILSNIKLNIKNKN